MYIIISGSVNQNMSVILNILTNKYMAVYIMKHERLVYCRYIENKGEAQA